MISVQDQKEELREGLTDLINKLSETYSVQAFGVETGFTMKGNGLGSRSFTTIKKPKVMMIVEGSVSSYEAGEVWHLFENRMDMPLVKVPERNFGRVDLDRYNVIIMVSGSYRQLQKKEQEKLKAWISKGNTLITSARASSWVINKKLVNEKLVKPEKDSSEIERMDYADARGAIGKQNLGGAIFGIDLDITHPIGYGYFDRSLPVYKNNRVWLQPSSSRFATVARYQEDPHIDGYITKENLELMSKSASILVSKVGSGRVVLFADNPNFRSAWYGTNKLLMNAVLFGHQIAVPK